MYREANRLAHCLAKIALKTGESAFRTREIPLEAVSILETEKFGL